MAKKYVIGIDYGTDSVRSVVVDTTDGKIVGTSVFDYPRWKKGLYCDASINQFRQHPLDYIEGLEQTVKEAVARQDIKPCGMNILTVYLMKNFFRCSIRF